MGDGLDERSIARHLFQLRQRLHPGEELTFLGGARPDLDHDLFVVTTARLLCVDSRAGYAFTDGFALSDVVRASAREDADGDCVHVSLPHDGYWILRPLGTPTNATALAMAILDSGRAPHDVPGDGPIPHEHHDTPTDVDLSGTDYLHVVVSGHEVETMDLSVPLGLLTQLLHSRTTSRTFLERVSLSFHGYGRSDTELHEVPQVRAYAQALDQRFPYWLYYLDKRTNSFDLLWRCCAPPVPTPEDEAQTSYPPELEKRLQEWWLPALDVACTFAELDAEEREALADRADRYLRGERLFT
ncbi:hypothetical protein DV701_08635 [Ornithinimicrobium avium]|uniref:Uncharacterized protein n=1 Tax=Ornithinimicrobium avium TaxID=2283195 RepID=A0A345NMD2_9MICO|nr:hypothetical protein DV701_08635 [Ornithinimicrobium avium]